METILGLPALASEHGKDVDKLLIYVHYLMIALFIVWIVYFFLVLAKFHRSRSPRADYVGVRNHRSTYLEGAVVLAEAFLLIGLAIPLWAKVAEKFPPEEDATVVRVIAQQFHWNIVYPGPDGKFGEQDMRLITSANQLGLVPDDPDGKDDFVMLNEMRVPVDKPVIVHLSSKDVVHSFKVIALRTTQDAIPGMQIPLWFTPTKIGRYQINCAQLCGAGHYAMSSGFLYVDSEEDYQQWVASHSGSGASSTDDE